MPNPSTLLGFDYGSHKIGVAVGQTLTGTATPLGTLRVIRQQPEWKAIQSFIEEWQPAALVVGLPHPLNPQQKNIAAQARGFARQLEKRFRLPVHLADESLTSREAWSRIGGKAEKDPRQIDALAAKLILETWLNP